MAKKKVENAYSGMVGDVVFYEMYGKPVVRRRPSTKKEVTPKWKDAQDSFVKVMNLVKKLKTFIDAGFYNIALERSPYHTALSLNLKLYKEALRLEQVANLSWMQLSSGTLSRAETVTFTKTPANEISLSWHGTEKGLGSSIFDRLMVLVYNNSDQSCYINLKQAKRGDGQVTFKPSGLKQGDIIEVFIAFKSVEPTKKKNVELVSNSQWLGELGI